MIYRFAPTHGLIAVRGRLVGPTGFTSVRLALDTGAIGTMLNTATLLSVGYDLSQGLTPTTLTTAGNLVPASKFVVQSFTALGRTAQNFELIVHTLPHHSALDGLLGLDFLRDHVLTIDFQNGEITLTP
jgi:hypothetical protein